MATIDRNIHFYRISSNILESDMAAQKPDMKNIVQQLNLLAASPDTNFLDLTKEEKLGIWIDKKTFPLQIRFGKIRHKGFPQKSNGLTLEGLDLAGDGLVELTHMVFFDNGFVGVEYNFYGPRPRSLSDYIYAQTGQRIYFHKIVNKDIDKIFQELGSVLSVELRVRTSMLNTLVNEKNGLIEGMMKVDEATNSDIIEIGVKNYKKGDNRTYVSPSVVNFLKTLTKSSNIPALAGAKLEAENADGKTVRRNLLEDLFVFTTEVVKMDAYKAVMTADIYAKLKEIYKKNEDDLLLASQIEYN